MINSINKVLIFHKKDIPSNELNFQQSDNFDQSFEYLSKRWFFIKRNEFPTKWWFSSTRCIFIKAILSLRGWISSGVMKFPQGDDIRYGWYISIQYDEFFINSSLSPILITNQSEFQPQLNFGWAWPSSASACFLFFWLFNVT